MSEKGQTRHIVAGESIASIRQTFNYLTELRMFGEFDDSEYVEKLKDLVRYDESGQPWVILPRNGNWYRLTKEGPVPGEPPLELYRLLDEPSRPEAPVNAPASHCTGCGKPIDAGVRFCRQCGKPVSGGDLVNANACPSCGSEVATGVRFCSMCGASVK